MPMPEQRVFLGWVDPNKDWADNPLVRPEDDGGPRRHGEHHPLAATWRYGPGGPPHLRVVATTGGGKSSLLRMILRGLVRRPGRRSILVLDAEGAGEFTVFTGMPGITRIVDVNPVADPTSVEVAAEVLVATLKEANDRNEQMQRVQQAWQAHLVDPAHVQPPTYQPPAELFLVIDGWGTLLHNLNRYHRAKLDPVEDAVQTGILGRKVDVHLVIADQVMYAQRSKDDPGMPSRLKKQLNGVIGAAGALGMTDTEAGMAFDDPNAAKRIPPVPGGCLLKVGASMVPFVVPRWLNATTADPSVSSADRRAAYRLLPPPGAAA
jgi:hypothetical protein